MDIAHMKRLTIDIIMKFSASRDDGENFFFLLAVVFLNVHFPSAPKARPSLSQKGHKIPLLEVEDCKTLTLEDSLPTT